MTSEIEGVGAATELPATPPTDRNQHWIVTDLIDRERVRIACLRCVVSETIQVKHRAAGQVVADLQHFLRKHALCSSFREVPR